jgi:predicted transcriptional regulator
MAQSERRYEPPNDFIQDVFDGIGKRLNERLSEKGRGIFLSSHEALGVITEEILELIDAVHQHDPESIKEELIDVAVAAIWGLVSVKSGRTDWL